MLTLNKNNKIFLIVLSAYFSILLTYYLFLFLDPAQAALSNFSIFDLAQKSLGGMGDPASFAKAAIDIYQLGWVSEDNRWITDLWPPGHYLLQAYLISIFGEQAPIIIYLQLCSVLLFAVLLSLLFNFLNRYTSPLKSFLLPLLIFSFPVSRVFLLQHLGVSLGECFAIGFFLMGILFAMYAVADGRGYLAFISGVCIILAAYFRSQFDIILLSLTFFGLIFVIGIKINSFKNFFEIESPAYSIKAILILILGAQVGGIPWRLLHYIQHGEAKWVFTSSLTFRNSVYTTEFLQNNSGGFVVEGGGNLTCILNPGACGNVANAEKLFFQTFFSHPVEWYSAKIEILGKYWFSNLNNWGSVVVESGLSDYFYNSVLLVMLLVITIAPLSKRYFDLGELRPVILWVNISLLAAYGLIFTLAHYEVRYFYFPKILIIFMFIIIMSRLSFRNLESDGVKNKFKL